MSITRPTSDITVTGWSGSAGAPLYAAIDETTASDADYIISPPDLASPVPVKFGMTPSTAAGSYDVRFRAMSVTGVGNVQIKLYSSSDVLVGESALQAVTGSYADYTVTVSTSGAADRFEIVAEPLVTANGFSLGGVTLADAVRMGRVFSDTAGTTPAVQEGTVANIFDATGNSHPALQSTAGQRPKLTARVNLLTHTEDFAHADWLKVGCGITSNVAVAPDGTTTADKYTKTTAPGFSAVYQLKETYAPTVFSFYAKYSGHQWAVAYFQLTGIDTFIYFDIQNGIVGDVGAGCTASIEDVGNGWYRCNVYMTLTSIANISIFSATANGVYSYTSDGTSGLYIWGGDFRLVNPNLTIPDYQRVTTDTDYDATGFPYRLQYDYVDDAMTTTLPAFDGEVWINTPHGHYKSEYHGAQTMTLPQVPNTGPIVREGALTTAQKAVLAATFATDQKYAIWVCTSTTVVFTIPSETITFVGANGVTTTKTNMSGSVNLATDGLTAPVVCVLPASMITNTSATALNFAGNSLTGALPSISGNTALTSFAAYSNAYTGSIPDVSAISSLATFHVYGNKLTGFGGSVPAALLSARYDDNALPAVAVNAILAAFVAAGATGGTLNLSGGTNAAPTGAGITDAATLISRGWTVTTN